MGYYACYHVHFVLVLDPHLEVSLLVGNVYQVQASQPEQQDALLNLISRVIERWGSLSNRVIIGGDWNASPQQRISCSYLAHIGLADALLRSWSVANSLACEAPADYTRSRVKELHSAVLDAFFWKSKSGKPSISNAEAFQSSDPTLNHATVRVILHEEQIGDMPPLDALRRPVQIRLDRK